MLKKPKDYDVAPSFDSDISKLPAGGYLCQIKKMEEGTTARGSEIVKVYFDICEGEHAGYYEKQYRAQGRSGRGEAKWKGVYDVFPLTPEGATSGAWKGLLTCIERSNGMTIDWNKGYEQFKGKKVGLLFREEEYISSYDQSLRVAVKPCAARTYDSIRDGDFTVPPRKALNKGNTMPSTEGFTPVDTGDDELPF